MTFLVKLSRLSFQDLALFAEACFFLVLASVARVAIPFRWYAPFFGSPARADHEYHFIEGDDRVLVIGQAVQRGSRYLPLACKCLVQAMAAKTMLRLRGIKCLVYFGVAKVKDKELIAHAWVKCGDRIVVGARGHRRHEVISIFAE